MKKKDPKTGKDAKGASAQKPMTEHYRTDSSSQARIAGHVFKERGKARVSNQKDPRVADRMAVNEPVPTQAQVRAVLTSAGLSLPLASRPLLGKLTVEQRATLARRLSSKRPMSDLISEDREGR
jgi:hypothetical protein